MQRAGARAGSTVSFLMEFNKYEGPRATCVQVEHDDMCAATKKQDTTFKVRPGDWNCPDCHVWNFARNSECRTSGCRVLNPKRCSPSSQASSTLASKLWEQSKAAQSGRRSRSR